MRDIFSLKIKSNGDCFRAKGSIEDIKKSFDTFLLKEEGSLSADKMRKNKF